MTGAAAGDLDRIDLLRPLSPADRKALAARCSWRRFRGGERILSRETDDRDVLFIVEGRVRVVNYTASGREIAFAVIEAGNHVGELAAIDGAPRSASVEALGDCQVAALSQRGFHDLLLAHGDVALILLGKLAQVIRRSDERIAELSILSAMQRVYRELLRLGQADGDGIVVSPLPTQESLAAHTGTTRETVARALGQLAKTGLARRRGRELLIRDAETLEALAELEA